MGWKNYALFLEFIYDNKIWENHEAVVLICWKMTTGIGCMEVVGSSLLAHCVETIISLLFQRSYIV